MNERRISNLSLHRCGYNLFCPFRAQQHELDDPLVLVKVKGMAHNVVELMNLGIEEKLKGKLVPVAE